MSPGTGGHRRSRRINAEIRNLVVFGKLASAIQAKAASSQKEQAGDKQIEDARSMVRNNRIKTLSVYWLYSCLARICAKLFRSSLVFHEVVRGGRIIDNRAMPLPNDEKIVALADALLQQFDAMFGVHPGFRPAHAKGILLAGTFTPSGEAVAISRAPHFERATTPVTVRFSNSTGIPVIPDNDANANPRGMAVRFHLGDRVHTDIAERFGGRVSHADGEEVLEFLRAAAESEGAEEVADAH